MLICQEQDSNQGQHRMAVFEDCQAITLTTQPQRLDKSAFICHYIKVLIDNLPLVVVSFTAILYIEAPVTMQCKKC